MKSIGVSLIFLMLAGCVVAEQPPTTPPAPPVEDACGAGALQNLVGSPEDALDTYDFAGPMRLIRPGMAVTMDYLPGRLNIMIGPNGMITKIYCG